MSVKNCEADGCEGILVFVKSWEMKSKGTITRVDLFKCPICWVQKRAGEVIGRYEHIAKAREKKKTKNGAVSIAKQIDLDKFKAMRVKMKPREISRLLCQHFESPDDKATCQACLRSISRLNKKIEEEERKSQTFEDYGAFEEYPIVQEFIEDRTLRRVESHKQMSFLRRYWEHLDRKHPATWDENDLKAVVILIREWGIVPYPAQGALRAWFKFTDLKDDRGRPLLKHPLIEASRDKMSTGKKNGVEDTKTYLEPSEFLEVIEKTDSLVFEAMLYVHAAVGCREGVKKEASFNRGRGGIMGLDWSNVNWDRKTLDVYETKTKGGITWVDCPLDLFGDECLNKLREYWESRGRPASGPMFNVLYAHYRKFFKNFVTPLIGRKLTPHNMRDTHATWLLNMDVKVELIIGTTSRRLKQGYALGVGWMEPRMFFEHYARIMKKAQESQIMKAREGFKNYVS